ncbi:putative amidophosphoribosyltransferase, ComFC [Staphylococcus aureus]|nr:putative amidophosphoribosyltransferase, ComFC [Staphylococcus aureus]AWR00574.1 putative amidophosphoribosyltransferase, ComFC [Staphylococcus aureus]EHT70593.1 phosphoribosyl transferase domain protein [Staphylococcus aureus subsp. aureus CIG290]OMK04816.1 ComF operon protein C [Staphylococcus aureus]
MKEMIHQYKFLKDYYLCELLAHLIEIPQTTYDYIVPIPSSPPHDLSRTFNPVEAVLKAKGIRFDKILKMSNRPKQSHLTKKERLADENPFIIDTELDLNDKEILLVDDIYTTGLTIHRAGCKLYAKNIRKFKVFAFAR